MKTLRFFSLFLGAVGLAGTLVAQQWVNPHFDAHRLDYRDLGYPTQNLIPSDNSGITALLAHSNGLVYGATSGRTQSYLFLYNKFINKVRPLGRIAAAAGVHHALVEGRDGEIWIGTGLNVLAPVALTKDFPVEFDGIVLQLWKDITAPYAGFAGGHLYRYNPKAGDVKRYTNDDECPVEDLGIPVARNSIYALVANADRSKLYGLTYPDAHFFEFDVASRRTRDLGEFLAQRVYGGPERTWRSVPRALHCDPQTGAVYTSGDNGWIVRYTPGAEKLELTHMRLPGEYWEGGSSSDYPVVECFDTDAAGRVYAGTSDGFLLRLDLANDRAAVLGKARDLRRMRAMKVANDGRLYLISGERERVCRLHTYDLAGDRGFEDLGVLAVDRSPYYAHRAYQLDAMAIGSDGTVFCGESDRGGKLFLYVPGPGPFPGEINPTNPRAERQRPGTPALIPENL